MENEEDYVVDLSEGIDEDAMPCCPICENGIEAWEPAAIIFAHGAKALAHTICLCDLRTQLGV